MLALLHICVDVSKGAKVIMEKRKRDIIGIIIRVERKCCRKTKITENLKRAPKFFG